MKKLAAILCLSAVATAVFAQGTVNFLNSPTTLVSTNGVGALGPGTLGNTSPSTSGYYYYFALFTAPSTVTSLGGLGDLSTPTWTFTTLYGTNTVATAGGRFSGGSSVSAQGWVPGQTNSYIVVGWSQNVGHDWASVQPQFVGATNIGGVWHGANLLPSSQAGYLGWSAIGAVQAGGGTTGIVPTGLFGAGANAQGVPITTGFALDFVLVPEPSTFALAGLGAAALLIFRRRK